MTYLTVPISAESIEKCLDQITAAVDDGAEMLELRTDYLLGLCPEMVKKLISMCRAKASLPLIVTCRDIRQGGENDYPVDMRIKILTTALDSSAEFVDLEYDNFKKPDIRQSILDAIERNPGASLILSEHNFQGKFEDLAQRYDQIKNACADAIPKLVYTANDINDCFQVFDLLANTKGRRIVLCMGQGGIVSRILAKKFDALVTFASINAESATAPGQLTIAQLKNIYRFDSIDSKTELFGIIGWPLAQSLSPVVHNAFFSKLDANKLYLPLLVNQGKAAFDTFMDNVISRPQLCFRGFSVTIPHKQNAIEYVAAAGGFVDPLTKKIGASNTLTLDPKLKLSAYNTDYTGAIEAITSKLGISKQKLAGLKVAVLGAGGVGRAIVAALSEAHAQVKIYNRTVSKAEKLAKEFGCCFASIDQVGELDADLLINCTSVGMYPDSDRSPLPEKSHRSETAVFDTIYKPVETLLLKNAKKAGAKTIGGLDMFVPQAVAQARLFTEVNPDPEFFRKTISDCLRGR